MSNIVVLKVELEKSPKGYTATNISYKTEDGKVKSMKVLPFSEPQKAVAEAFASAASGDVYDVQLAKNDRGYWEFAAATKTGAKESAPAAKGSTGASKGGWETPEERAARQVMIVRQSSVSSAVNYASQLPNPTVERVIEVAKQFEAYVLSQPVGEIQ